MVIIADQVRSWLLKHPLHATFLAQGIINSSALARQIKPELQAQTKKKVSLDAIILTLNRYAKNNKSEDATIAPLIGNVVLQSDLSMITIPQADLNVDAFSKALSILHKSREYTLYTRGAWHISLIGKKGIVEELTRHFRYTTIAHNVAAITVQLLPEHTSVPSAITYLLQNLTTQNIGIHETISSHNELTIVINEKATNKALKYLGSKQP